MWASQYGHLEVVKYLIEKGADVHYGDKYKITALICASMNDHLEVVKYLVENGADVNSQFGRSTALREAPFMESSEIVKYLIENGANEKWSKKY